VDDIETRFGQLSAGAWHDDVCRMAAVIPLAASGRHTGLLGFMVVGLSPRLAFDERYRNFIELAAAQVAAAVASADVHENERRRAEALEMTHQALRVADQHKSEFLAVLGHELRTPLAPIRHATDLLRMAGPESDRQRWARSVLERQVQFLASLIDDLLDVTRISRGQILLQRAPVDLREVIHAAVEASRAAIDGRRHRLEVAIGYPIWVDGDRTRLVQVISNLLHNAAKYTDDGGLIQVVASRRCGDAVITVSDDGVGMTRDTLDKAFELFMQVDSARDRKQTGLGIGLTLARRLVELHGGTVRAFSEGPSRGSQFVVTLPAIDPDPPA
jgi:signal transduction histidine kinase